jgi:alkylated DNA nucleotide flippase Atl1
VEESYPHKEAVVLAGLKLSIEHILPQTLSDEWQHELRHAGEDPDALFIELGHSLGNLTLTAYNGELSNGRFDRKKQIYKASNLQLNRELAKVQTWGRQEILDRGEHLAERIIAIWPAPVPGAKGVMLGYDWSRIDSAVMAIPQGQWTSYGDLAALGQTHPQPVGAHMSSGSVPNAHRVLDAHGRVADGFRWPSADDTRDVREVLEAEGVKFGSDGVADHSQRLRAYDLAQLVPYDLDPEEMEDLRLRSERTSGSESEDGSEWLTDGRTWHLNHLKTQAARELLLGLVSFIESSVEGMGPTHWEQKRYVAWQNQLGNRWIVVSPSQQWMKLTLRGSQLNAADVAERLNYVFVPPESTFNTSNDGPSQVGSYKVDQGASIQFRHLGDLSGAQGDALRLLIQETWAAAQQEGVSQPEGGGAWIENGRAWHLAHLKAPSAQELLLGLVELIESSDQGIGKARWDQKYYISWQNRLGTRWALIRPHQQWMRLHFRGSRLDAAAMAQRLGYVYVPPGSAINTSHDGPCQVGSLGDDVGVWIQFRHLEDLSGDQGDVLRSLVRETWAASQDSKLSDSVGAAGLL